MQETNSPAILSDLVAYDSSLYESVDLTGLAAFVLNALIQRNIPTTFENIVVAAYRLFIPADEVFKKARASFGNVLLQA